MKQIEFSQRLKRLPPYLFAEIDKKKKELRQRGVDFIDLSIGDPDILAPQGAIETLYSCAQMKENQRYALDQGKPSLRQAIQRWFLKRFNVDLNPEEEILPLIGSKEGLVHFPLAFIDKGDYMILPDPAYPGYRGAALLSGAKVYTIALLEKNKFLPALEKIPLSVRKKARIIYLNYPHNPTTSVCPFDFLEGLVRFCSRYGIILVYDNAYSEIYFEEKPHSVLEVKGAGEIAIEFHSFSKTFCMTGFRIGWACGNKDLIKGLLKVKTNIDSGIFGAIQDTATYVLENEAEYVENLRREIRARRDLFLQGLKRKGFCSLYAEATFYVWARVPSGFKSSLDFSRYLLEEKRIVATPGIGFGKNGDGFIRFALTVDKERLAQAVENI